MQSLEDIDLARLSARLRERFNHHPPLGYLRGRTVLRDAVAEALGCSDLEAEELVDTLESRRFLRFNGDPSQRAEADSTWTIDGGEAETE